MGQAKNRGTYEERVQQAKSSIEEKALQAIREAKVQESDKISPNGKVVNGKFVYTREGLPGHQQMDEDFIKDMGDQMLKSYQDPNSMLSKMTAEMRAKGIHCMKDDLDNGADIYELCRRSVGWR